MACSISVILYNSELRVQESELTTEYVFSNLNFPYPIFLTTWHLAFSVR